MSDTYQATYDAVRSRVGNGDIGAAVESAMHSMNIGHYVETLGQQVIGIAAHHLGHRVAG